MTVNKSKIYSLVCILFIIVCELFFLRDLLVPGAMIGDAGDARMYNLILEHWLHWVQGQEPLTTFSESYPFTNTMGYSDLMLSEALLYVPMRLLGINMFTACKIPFVLLHTVGSLSLFYFFKRFIKAQDLAALIGVFSFSFANSYALRIIMPQLINISLLPVIMCAVGYLCENYYSKPKRIVISLLVLTLVALLAYSGWYIFYLSAIFIGFFAGILLLIFFLKKYDISGLINFIKDNLIEFIIEILYFAGLLLPLALLYLSIATEYGTRSWQETLGNCPQIYDVVNVGEGNFVLGRAIYSLIQTFALRQYWFSSQLCQGHGYSLVFLSLLGWLLFKYFRPDSNESTTRDEIYQKAYIGAFALTILFMLITVVRVGPYSLWWLMWKFLPGAGSIRIVSRAWFFLLLPSAVLLTHLINNRKFKTWQLVLIATAIWVTNINVKSISYWNAYDQFQLLSTVPPPPASAKIIAVFGQNYNKKIDAYLQNAHAQLDAWLIADHYRVKTINGYGLLSPVHSELLSLYADRDPNLFPINVLRYKYIYGIKDTIYIYNLSQRTWTTDTDYLYPSIPALNKTYQFAQENWAVYLGDFYQAGNFGYWLGREGTLYCKIPTQVNNGIKMTLHACAFYSDRPIDIFINNKLITSLTIRPTNDQYSFNIPSEALKEDSKIEIKLIAHGELLSPADVFSDNSDNRKLSILLRALTITSDLEQ